jgi:methionyl-tRNA formyltransferase
MKIAYLGSGRFGLNSLEAIAASGHELAMVVTNPARPAGRGRRLQPTPVAVWARARNIEPFECEDVNSDQAVSAIASAAPGLLVVVAFGQKISERLASLAPFGSINVHASLLPAYRGAAPVNWAIIRGEKRTGVSVIRLAQQMDAGAILGASELDILPGERADELAERLSRAGADLLLRTIDAMETGSVAEREQDHSRATPAPRLAKADGLLDFSASAEEIARRVRGLWPWPGASAVYLNARSGRRERVVLAGARVTDGSVRPNVPAGSLDSNLDVACGRGLLRIEQIKPRGGAVMDFRSFVNGRNVAPGDLFQKPGPADGLGAGSSCAIPCGRSPYRLRPVGLQGIEPP